MLRAIQQDMPDFIEVIRKRLNLDNITFYYSTKTEFIEMLKATKKNSDKYPFFFINASDVQYNDTDMTCTVAEIVIATISEMNWKAPEREKESMTILKPIYSQFLELGRYHKYVKINKEGTMQPHYFYGKTGIDGYESGIFPDHVDAISLNNFVFRLKKQCNL